MRKNLMKKLASVAVLSMITIGAINAEAAATIQGHLDVSYHLVPVLKDKATAYTTISKPTQDYNNCASITTVKIYNSNGDYESGTYSETGTTWDLPLNAGAVASIRGAKKAVGTHKAKSYDTNYQYKSTDDTYWSK